MKRWCPIAHSDCVDGCIKESEFPCIFWDSIDNECIQSAAGFLQLGRLRASDDTYLSTLGKDDVNQ